MKTIWDKRLFLINREISGDSTWSKKKITQWYNNMPINEIEYIYQDYMSTKAKKRWDNLRAYVLNGCLFYELQD
jgi:hypothetical protein